MHRIGSWLAIAILLGIPAVGVAQDRYFVSDGVRIRYVERPELMSALRQFISAHPAR
jgi:hypothetical protein